MTQFGGVAKYENAVYTFNFTPAMMPRAITTVAPGSSERDFLIVPEMATTHNFPQLGRWPFSRAFDAHFYYLGGKPFEANLQSEEEDISISSISFAVVRWNPRSTTPFPARLYCLAQDPDLPHLDHPFTEVLEAGRTGQLHEEATTQ